MTIHPAHCIAHRGYQKHYPENTLLAIHQAIAVGALHVELDIQLSADQVPVIYHDDTLDRISARQGKVSAFNASELQTFSAHEPGRFGQKFREERIASLSGLVNVIKANPEVTFYIELKEEAVRDHGVQVCLQRIIEGIKPVLPQCVLISFDLGALEQAKHLGFGRIGPVLRDWSVCNTVVEKLGATVLFINKKRLPAGVVSAACPIAIYEVDNPEEAKQWLQRGVTMVETFAMGEMIGVKQS